MVKIVLADDETLRAKAYALRHAVFVVEQGVPEQLERDELDETAIHLVAISGDDALATGRLVRQAEGVGRVGRMAVAARSRRRGLGERVLAALEERARAEGLQEIELHAQLYVEAFYLRHGYARVGEPFVEAGIDHVVMRKRLA
jgi:predicted GNAT family N-acyltransferase